jgi:SAM-dependent methyltransferase
VGALVDPRRQFNCQNQGQLTWDERAEAAVELLRSCLGRNGVTGTVRVADLGCGNERLRRILDERLQRPFAYVGYDLHPQSEGVMRLDVEQDMPGDVFDVVFCLGLLEYLRNPELFAQRLRDVCRIAIVSYAVADAADALSPSERRRLGWRTDFTGSQLERVFEANGFERDGFATAPGGATGLWVWIVRGASVDSE